jgi:hypothetical protein
MHDYNLLPGIKKQQEQFAKEYFEEVVAKLTHLRDEVYRLGNDGGETSKIEELITQFKEDKISGEKALEEADKIIHGKEAGIDAKSGGH